MLGLRTLLHPHKLEKQLEKKIDNENYSQIANYDKESNKENIDPRKVKLTHKIKEIIKNHESFHCITTGFMYPVVDKDVLKGLKSAKNNEAVRKTNNFTDMGAEFVQDWFLNKNSLKKIGCLPGFKYDLKEILEMFEGNDSQMKIDHQLSKIMKYYEPIIKELYSVEAAGLLGDRGRELFSFMSEYEHYVKPQIRGNGFSLYHERARKDEVHSYVIKVINLIDDILTEKETDENGNPNKFAQIRNKIMKDNE